MIILNIFLVLLVGAVGGLYLYFKRKFQYWGKLGVPHLTPSIPFGNLKGLGTSLSIGQAVNSVYGKFQKEKFVGMWVFFNPVLLVRDPELVKSVFVRDFMSFHDRGIYVNDKDDPLSGHLFSIAGAKWRNLRVKLTPTFTSGKMKMMFPILTECSKKFITVLDEPASRGEIIEIKEYSARFTTDIISLAAFGIETDSLNNPDSEFRHYGQLVFNTRIIDMVRGFFSALFPETGKRLHLKTNRDDVSEFFLKAFKESMDYRETNKIRRNDFMDLLIQLKNKGKLEDVDTEASGDGTKFTFEEAAAQAFVFFVAGFETSSTTMQFALYELAKSPQIQEEARKEVLTVLKKYNGEITYDAVMEMNYLGRCIDETLRMFPPVPFLQRECNKDYKVPDSDLVLKKGTTVFIDVIGLHQDAQHYPNPDKFDPDRFLDDVKAERHHYAYLPFGEGPRNCIGMRFGLMQTKVGLIALLSNYKFSVADSTPIPMVLDPKSFIQSPKDGMNLKLTKI